MNIKIKWIYWGVGIAAVIAIAFLSISKTAEPQNVLDVNLKEHKSLALHIHPKVSIEILGKDYPIPSNIGISSEGMKVIHTHESDGTLHVESPYPHQFYLEDFFTIWGKRFTGTCIFEYCADENHSLKIYANGDESTLYGLLPLYDHDEIKIVYGESGPQ